MSFNPDPSKQGQETIFIRKTKKICHPLLCFNNSIVLQSPYQKCLGIFLYAWLTFEEYLKVITTKINKTIGLLCKLQKTLQIKLLHFILNITFSKILFFHPPLLKLDPNLRSATSFSVFKRNLLKFSRPSPNSVSNCCNCKGIKYLTRLCLCLSHLLEHKLKHSFQDTLNPFCSCGLDVETNMHFFLYCLSFTNQRRILWAQLMILIVLWQILMIRNLLIHLFGKVSLDTSANSPLLNATMNYINEQIWRKSFLFFVYFCYIFISLTFFPYPNVFFVTIYSFSCSS